MPNIDCSKDMENFHSKVVTLSRADQDEMRSRRDNGRTRLKKGLERENHPLPKEFSSQGSYAMRTMVEDSQCEYDIDDGAYFPKDDLKVSSGAFLAPKAARQRICDALNQDERTYDAIVKTNCVRQEYAAGYHIDIPVYRTQQVIDLSGAEKTKYELASGDEWIESDAREVTKWFNGKVGEDIRRGQTDHSQLRRLTKLTKAMARSRISWKSKTTGGICISKLIVDHLVTDGSGDDKALRKTWQAIKKTLEISLEIKHPVLVGKLLARFDDSGVQFFRDCLIDSLKTLEILDEEDCTEAKARKAWDKVFNCSFFSNEPSRDDGSQKAESSNPFALKTGNLPTTRVDNGRRFG